VRIQLRHYMWSLAAGIAVAALAAVTAGRPGFYTGLLWVPGFFGAALVFRTWISDSPTAYLVLGWVIDVLVYAAAVLGIWVLIVRSREKRLGKTGEHAR
jgi:hypothetical protein